MRKARLHCMLSPAARSFVNSTYRRPEVGQTKLAPWVEAASPAGLVLCRGKQHQLQVSGTQDSGVDAFALVCSSTDATTQGFGGFAQLDVFPAGGVSHCPG